MHTKWFYTYITNKNIFNTTLKYSNRFNGNVAQFDPSESLITNTFFFSIQYCNLFKVIFQPHSSQNKTKQEFIIRDQ